jgi:hypothetical protein
VSLNKPGYKAFLILSEGKFRRFESKVIRGVCLSLFQADYLTEKEALKWSLMIFIFICNFVSKPKTRLRVSDSEVENI